MNKKILFFFLLASMLTIESSVPKLTDQVKLPEGITPSQKLIITGNKIDVEFQFNNARTPEDRFEIALLGSRADLLASTIPKTFGQRAALSFDKITNAIGLNMQTADTSEIDALVNLDIDPQGTKSKPLHMATKIAAYQRNLAEAETNLSKKNMISNKYEQTTKIIKILLDNDANPNAEDYKKRTPLHIACELNEFDSAKIILQNKNVDPTAISKDGKTPQEYLRKDILPSDIYDDFQKQFRLAEDRAAVQNKKAVAKILAKNKAIPETSILPEEELNTSLPAYKSSRNRPKGILTNPYDENDTKPKRGERRAPRPTSALVSELPTTPAVTPTNRITVSELRQQKLTITNNARKASSPQNKDTSIQITQTESTDIKVTQRISSRDIETRYLAPTKLVKPKSINPSPSPSTSPETSINFASSGRSSVTNTKIPTPEPVLIISQKPSATNPSSFTTPVKIKPIATTEPVKKEGLLSNMYNSMFGSSPKVMPLQSISPKTNSTASSPAHSEISTPDALEQMQTKPHTALSTRPASATPKTRVSSKSVVPIK